MKNAWTTFIVRLETLTMRERLMLLLGLPLVLVLAAEALIFSPARTRAAQATQQLALQEAELKALSVVLAAKPAALPALPAADQLERQKDEMQAQIDSARRVLAGVRETVDWGTVVRAAVAGTPGLSLTTLKTQPAELVYSPAKAAAAAAAAASANAKPPVAGVAAGASPAASATATKSVGPGGRAAASDLPFEAAESIYRHRADIAVKGDFAALMRYLQALQQVPGALHWDRLQLSVAAYPQATAQLSLFTLSHRSDTPFN